MTIPVECLLALGALLFFIGVFGFVTRRNLVAMLISVELILNAVDLNFAVINRFFLSRTNGRNVLHSVLNRSERS